MYITNLRGCAVGVVYGYVITYRSPWWAGTPDRTCTPLPAGALVATELVQGKSTPRPAMPVPLRVDSNPHFFAAAGLPRPRPTTMSTTAAVAHTRRRIIG